MTTICDYCFWRDVTYDEIGAIDYCVRRDIYGDIMEDMKDCLYHKRKGDKDGSSK
jgi:hypothetical protein